MRDQDIDINQSKASVLPCLLPDLYSSSSVASLILVGELLAFALVLAKYGGLHFDWAQFGLISVLIQWIILTSSATMIILRARLESISASIAVSLCYSIVLLYTLIFSVVASWYTSIEGIEWYIVFSNVLIAAIFSGVLFRYIYIQQLLKQKEQAELQARVQALQSRIRPHFLFNSLNSIASLIVVDPTLAEKLVVDLSSLFRASLQLPQMVDIEKELVLCRSFGHIEEVRLGSRLKILWQVDPLPENTKILNLLLQPIIENAIFHGVQPREGGGVIHVHISAQKENIILRVQSPMIDLQISHAKIDHKGNGLAISNIRDRLQAHYGNAASLRIVKDDKEYCVIVRYPHVLPRL